jgi:DNA gyrase subunit A
VAAGVNGIKLDTRDEVVAVEKITKDAELLLLTSNGLAWRIAAEDFPVQGRYGQGVIACRPSPGAKLVGEMSGKRTQTGTIHFERAASQNIRLDEIPLSKRAVSSKNSIPVKAGDAIIQLTVPVDGVAFWAVAKPEAEKKPRSIKPKVDGAAPKKSEVAGPASKKTKVESPASKKTKADGAGPKNTKVDVPAPKKTKADGSTPKKQK